MRYRLKFSNARQEGFTLIDMIMTLAIMCILGPGIAVTIYQMFDENDRAAKHTEATLQVENAGYWINHDCLMAQKVVTAEGSGFPLILRWITWSDQVIQVTYTLTGDKLQRSLSINQGTPEQRYVAEKIEADPGMTNCQLDPLDICAFTLKITASVGSLSETRTYQIRLRPESTSWIN